MEYMFLLMVIMNSFVFYVQITEERKTTLHRRLYYVSEFLSAALAYIYAYSNALIIEFCSYRVVFPYVGYHRLDDDTTHFAWCEKTINFKEKSHQFEKSIILKNTSYVYHHV